MRKTKKILKPIEIPSSTPEGLLSRKEKRQPKKTLILIRHAHRDTHNRGSDNGLSPKGKQQAELIAKYFSRSSKFERAQKEETAWVSSPKKRCLETLATVAKTLHQKVTPVELLSERAEDEMLQHFEHRIRDFCDWWITEAPALTVVCSHGDWILLAAEILTGGRVQTAKGSWCEIVIEEGSEPALRWLIQNFGV